MTDVRLELPEVALDGDLDGPDDPAGLVAFAHGSGSSRHSPRNQAVARRLREAGFTTLLFDLLTVDEADDRSLVFDIHLLGGRLAAAVDAAETWPGVGGLPVGLFGASTGAAAALNAAVDRPNRVAAVVSRGGRPDLGRDLPRVQAPTLLIVGGADEQVLDLNARAAEQLTCDHALEVVPGAGHLFEGPGELDRVADLAADWFSRWLAG